MDLLENLYNIENFGIYLFIIIGALIVLFLVILFFGKKDEKKRKLEKTQQVDEQPTEENNVSVIPETVSDNTEVVSSAQEMYKTEENSTPPLETNEHEEQMPFKEIEEPTQPVEIPTPVLEKPTVPDLASVALSQIEEEQKESTPVEPKQEEKIEEPKIEKEFDFDALADAINKELASIEKPEESVVTPVLPKEEEAPLQYSVVEEEKPVSVESALQTNSVEMPKTEKKVMPTVFSSVYVNREKEEPIVMPKEEKVAEPVAPKIELPKTIELPKKNNE